VSATLRPTHRCAPAKPFLSKARISYFLILETTRLRLGVTMKDYSSNEQQPQPICLSMQLLGMEIDDPVAAVVLILHVRAI